MSAPTTLRPQFDRRCQEDTGKVFLLWVRSSTYPSVAERSGVRRFPQRLPLFGDLVQEYRRRTLADLLACLNSRFGFEWNEVAKVAGVSRQSVTKWRTGRASPDSRRFSTLCKLTAFSQMIKRRGSDPALWLKTRLQVADDRDSRFSVADVLSTGNFRLALKHFDGSISDLELLREVFPRYSAEVPGLATIELSDGVFVVSLDALGLVAAGEDMDEVQEDVLFQVRDYISDWHDFLSEREPHTSNRRIVQKLEQADEGSSLPELLFGR